MKKSTQTVICEKILKISSAKAHFISEKNANKMLNNRKITNEEPYKQPLATLFYAKKHTKENMDYYKIPGTSDKVVLYLHGGAFVNRPLIFHWKFIRDLNKITNATVYFPIYPLAPVHNYKETYAKLLALYKHILKRFSPENITIMGESAGGTLTVGMGVLLRDKKLPEPNYLIPISACYDLSFDNKDIEKLDDVDVMLHSIGCRIACQSWCGKENIRKPIVSPLFANVSGLPKMLVIVGTNEIMLPDTRLFVAKLKANNINYTYIEKNEMGHAYPLYPTPEAREVKEMIYKIVTGKNIE